MAGSDGNQTMATPVAITAARFMLSCDLLTKPAFFAELGGISSEVEGTEYITVEPGQQGKVVNYSKQYGKTKPPTVTLKRGVDGNGEIWAWHRNVRNGLDKGRTHATLTICDASGTARGAYLLEGLWPTKMEVSGLKAGDSGVVYENVTFVCSDITYQPEQ
ncbi:phage tail protein [Streptacidiphilus anmyonensis]|uniref:phage tail protein n=1 Tax=Streptacidiphilus anmyonensis TaxID=405782 RepID=UPI0005A7602E|nr:phage tail protein [Streptacidiphilus anmyonensis]